MAMRRVLLQTVIVCLLGTIGLLYAPLEPAGTGARLGLLLLWLAGLFWVGFRSHRLLRQRAAGN
jgi:hypothetical protein